MPVNILNLPGPTGKSGYPIFLVVAQLAILKHDTSKNVGLEIKNSHLLHRLSRFEIWRRSAINRQSAV